MNELDLTIRGATLDEIHDKGGAKAAQFFGDRWKPSLVRCDVAEFLISNSEGAVLFEAQMTYRGVPAGVRVTNG